MFLIEIMKKELIRETVSRHSKESELVSWIFESLFVCLTGVISLSVVCF